VILDASARIGDAWRKRCHAAPLHARCYNGLDGLPFPGSPGAFLDTPILTGCR
jgi:hypothetical protein